jgi:hypothetical protein
MKILNLEIYGQEKQERIMVIKDLDLDGLLKKLQAERKIHGGKIKVFYASDYDWVLPLRCVEVIENPGWEGAPKKKALYIE